MALLGLGSWIRTCPRLMSPPLHYIGLAFSATSNHPPKPTGFYEDPGACDL